MAKHQIDEQIGAFASSEGITEAEVDAMIEEVQEMAGAMPVLNEMPEGMFEEVFRASTASGPGAMGGGAELLERRKVTFPLNGADGLYRRDGAPVFSGADGTIYDPIVTMRTLTAREEIEALKGVAETPESAPYQLALACVWKVSGKVLTRAERAWFWEAIGPAGRQRCLAQFAALGSASLAEMGKAR